MKTWILLVAVLMVVLVITDAKKHKHWNHKHHGKKDHYHHKFKDHEVKGKDKYSEKEFRTQERIVLEYQNELKTDVDKINELNPEQGKRVPLDTKRKNLRHEGGHQEKVQHEKYKKENKTPKNNERKDEKVKLTKKVKGPTVEVKVKDSKYQKEKGEKPALTRSKTISPEDGKNETETPKVLVKPEQTEGEKMESSTETQKNESPVEKVVKSCTSSNDCQPGLCCQSKKEKAPRCQKVKLGLGQRCKETCMCGEGLVCHFEGTSLEKKKVNGKNPMGVCKEPETASL